MMNTLKLITISIIFCCAVVLIFLFIDFPVSSGEKPPQWDFKKEEIINRFRKVPILLYHNIDGSGPFSITSAELRKHFELFKSRGVKVISLREMVLRLSNPRPFDSKVIALTFDDGYRSMYTKLLPLVKEFHYPVTLFVYTDFICNHGKSCLTWKQLREMERHGIEIQCHSISHPDLSAISPDGSAQSRRRLFNEIYLSRRIIELYMKKNIAYYAFPYGRYDLNIVEISRNAGFEKVFSTDYGDNIISRDNFCLRRQHIKNSFSIKTIEGFIK